MLKLNIITTITATTFCTLIMHQALCWARWVLFPQTMQELASASLPWAEMLLPHHVLWVLVLPFGDGQPVQPCYWSNLSPVTLTIPQWLTLLIQLVIIVRSICTLLTPYLSAMACLCHDLPHFLNVLLKTQAWVHGYGLTGLSLPRHLLGALSPCWFRLRCSQPNLFLRVFQTCWWQTWHLILS